MDITALRTLVESVRAREKQRRIIIFGSSSLIVEAGAVLDETTAMAANERSS